MSFLADHFREIALMTGVHAGLVAISVFIAAVVGIPAAILCRARPGLGRVILRLVDAIQTIPSLALFGFLIPIPFIGGIGARTAIVALVLYSILPIIRNTVTGLDGVDRNVLEAATALGMTPRQRLFEVELPLSAPSIVGGIRIATVIGVGVATIAAAIGGGGLGTFIFRGVAMLDHRLILAGAVPAALLALVADFGLSAVERSLARRRGEPRGRDTTNITN
jgi:osmoprotectant transport system permease protein